MPAASIRSGEDILLIGDQWTLNVFADAFIQKGVTPRTISLQTPIISNPTACPVYKGNGDTKDRVLKTMGPDLANYLWNLSDKNYDRAKDFFSRHKIAIYEKGLRRWEKETFVEESDAFSFNPENVKSLITPTHIGEIERIEKLSSFQVSTKLRNEDVVLIAPVMIFLSDLSATEKFPFLWDKIVPVTLATFGYPIRAFCPDFSMSLHNQGADFAVRFDYEVHVGSFRNLYQDKAVGAHPVADPVTRKETGKFFGNLNWLDPAKTPTTSLSVESLSCDGLPMVGTFPEAPGVFFAGGFSARTANFIFEIAHQLAESILTDGKAKGLEPISLKRLS